jgi:hypothetical protein
MSEVWKGRDFSTSSYVYVVVARFSSSFYLYMCDAKAVVTLDGVVMETSLGLLGSIELELELEYKIVGGVQRGLLNQEGVSSVYTHWVKPRLSGWFCRSVREASTILILNFFHESSS